MAPTKSSRNATRKRLYADLADKGSRNQTPVGAPIIGRMETTQTRDGKPHQHIVHDREGLPATPRTKAPKRETSARKLRRQSRAWTNCRLLTNVGEHNFVNGNCRSCGCPDSMK